MFALALLQAAGAAAPPAYISPAPDPWPTPIQACELMRNEAKQFARVELHSGVGADAIEQVVDCEARVVTRVFAVNSRKVLLAESAQRTANKFACSNPRNQILYKRDGWSFRTEFRGPDKRVATATAIATCPG